LCGQPLSTQQKLTKPLVVEMAKHGELNEESTLASDAALEKSSVLIFVFGALF